jgi:hypothetical protein
MFVILVYKLIIVHQGILAKLRRILLAWFTIMIGCYLRENEGEKILIQSRWEIIIILVNHLKYLYMLFLQL